MTSIVITHISGGSSADYTASGNVPSIVGDHTSSSIRISVPSTTSVLSQMLHFRVEGTNLGGLVEHTDDINIEVVNCYYTILTPPTILANTLGYSHVDVISSIAYSYDLSTQFTVSHGSCPGVQSLSIVAVSGGSSSDFTFSNGDVPTVTSSITDSFVNVNIPETL